jgi:RNA polymerase sigma-70 factor (ECF subfamily)
MESDQSLAESILSRGDEGAFRILYKRHTPRLYQLVLRLLGGAESDAEDVVQETWLRVSQKLDRFRWESAFSTWLCAIGVHVAQDSLRRRGRERLTLVDSTPDSPIPAPNIVERIDLEQAVSALPDGCRQVLVLHDIEGMKHREIAQTLGISDGTSKSQLSDARRLLRSLLANDREKEHA